MRPATLVSADVLAQQATGVGGVEDDDVVGFVPGVVLPQAVPKQVATVETK